MESFAPSGTRRLLGDFLALFCGQTSRPRNSPFRAAEFAQLNGVRILGRVSRFDRIVGFAGRDIDDAFCELVRVARSARALLGHAENMAQSASPVSGAT
jgi:hypothetical protein